MNKRELWLTVLSLVGMFLLGLPALAATIAVTTTDDEFNSDGDCSLREAIVAANTDTAVDNCAAGSGADTIMLAAGATYTLSKDTDGGGHQKDSGADNDDLDITSEITIQGNGATIERSTALTCTLDGTVETGEFRIFHVASGSNLTLDNVTVRNGCADGDWRHSDGGGIANSGTSTMTITNSTLSNNSALNGGGIWNSGTANINFTTIVSNSAVNGGGIRAIGMVNIKNSIVGNNIAVLSGPNCRGDKLTPSGTNLATDASCPGFTQVTSAQLNLGPLTINAPGTTATHALQPGSAAIDAATDCTLLDGTTLTEDQRSVPRPQGPACDVGAYEAPFIPCSNVQVRVSPTRTTFRPTARRPDTRSFSVTVRNNSGGPVTVNAITLRSDKFDGTYTLVRISPTLPQTVLHRRSRTLTVLVRKAAATPAQTVTAPFFDVQMSCGMLPASEQLIPLRVEGLHTQIQAGQMRLEASGEGIASIGVELFDLSGRWLLTQSGEGRVLTVAVNELANGVYLAVVRVRGFDGREYVSEVRKLVIMR